MDRGKTNLHVKSGQLLTSYMPQQIMGIGGGILGLIGIFTVWDMCIVAPASAPAATGKKGKGKGATGLL